MHLHQAGEQITSAEEALQMLKEGNERYLQGKLTSKDTYREDREILQRGQHPFAVILCCSDSRVAPEIFFDEKLGDLFVVRNAGNVADDTVLGSIEYAVEHLGTPLVVVCGHSSCGAVTAACSGDALPPHIQSIADRIRPAVEQGGDVDAVIHHNVETVVRQIAEDDMIRELGTKVIGAYYDIHTGVVTWL